MFAEAGIRVVGLDVSQGRMDHLNAGESYIEDVLSEADAISICVPTPLGKTLDPDISYVAAVCDELGPCVRPGHVVVLESTTYPGTTREMVLPALEAGGLRVGEDFSLAFSPERVDPGREDLTTKNTPKAVGAMTPARVEVAAALYQTAIDTAVPVSSPEAAEMAKLLENTFRVVVVVTDHSAYEWDEVAAAASLVVDARYVLPGPSRGDAAQAETPAVAA